MADSTYKIRPFRSGSEYPADYRSTADGARKRAEALVQYWEDRLGERHRPTSVVVYRRNDSTGTWSNQVDWHILAVLEVGQDGERRWVAGDDAHRISSNLLQAKILATAAVQAFDAELAQFGVKL